MVEPGDGARRTGVAIVTVYKKKGEDVAPSAQEIDRSKKMKIV